MRRWLKLSGIAILVFLAVVLSPAFIGGQQYKAEPYRPTVSNSGQVSWKIYPADFWESSVARWRTFYGKFLPSIAYASNTADYIGSTDVAAQTALNALTSNGGRIDFSSGTYTFAAGVTRAIPNVTIVGAGKSTIFNRNGANPLFTAGGNGWEFRDLATDAGGINMGATTGWQWVNVTVGATYYPIYTTQGTSYLASPTFTGTVTFPVGDSLIASASNDAISWRGGQSGAGNGALIQLWGKTGTLTGAVAIYTPNAAFNGDVERVRVSGGLATAVATWSNVTQTWTSYGAGTLQTDAGGVITAVSDERLKDIQGNYNTGLKAILALQPISYKWNATANSTRGLDITNIYAGFSAQNVMQYIPEAVSTNPGGYYGITDRVILAALVNSIKELQLEIDALNVKVGLTPYNKSISPDLTASKIIKYVVPPSPSGNMTIK